MRLLVSGTRWATNAHRPAVTATMLDALLIARATEPHTLIEGGASGTDRISRQVASGWSWPVDTFEADWQRLGRAAGPVRNQRMVDRAHAEWVAAFPATRDGVKGGTGDLIDRAIRAGLPILIRPLDVGR